MKNPNEQLEKATHTDICLWLDYYGELLSERQLQVMTYFFADDLSLAEIADLTGLTRQGVHEQVRRGTTKLEELESKLKLARREQAMSQYLQNARDLLKSGDTEKTMHALDDIAVMLGLIENERS